MSDYAVLAWQPLLRPPQPCEPPTVEAGIYDVPLKALSCRNQITSVMALVVADRPADSARLVFSDLTSDGGKISADSIRARRIGGVPTPEAGIFSDPLFDVAQFAVDKCASFHIGIKVPTGIPAGIYRGSVRLIVEGSEVASNAIELEVANVDLPDVHDYTFFLNIWLNPASIARFYNVELWSDEHFDRMTPYIKDLAEHGQKTVVAPICYQPWGTQTPDPYPNLIGWTRRGGKFEFDFSLLDRYVELHEACGIDRAIHCYSVVQGPGDPDTSVIDFFDADAGERRQLDTHVGDEVYVSAWSAFFDAFAEHLRGTDWLKKTYIAFDEKTPDVMSKLVSFMNCHAPDFPLALAGEVLDEHVGLLEDLCLPGRYDEHGMTRAVPTERSTIEVAQLLCSEAQGRPRDCGRKMLTTCYVCCGPEWPNTFLFSPLVESRMLPFLALQGGYDGFLRWAYNDWPPDPFNHPEWAPFPTGDVFFVYPGEDGPVSSLRWEQLREGIADYELATIASANIREPDEMVDYEQAISLACRNPDGRTKSIGDIEIARRLLIPIAEHQTGK